MGYKGVVFHNYHKKVRGEELHQGRWESNRNTIFKWGKKKRKPLSAKLEKIPEVSWKRGGMLFLFPNHERERIESRNGKKGVKRAEKVSPDLCARKDVST